MTASVPKITTALANLIQQPVDWPGVRRARSESSRDQVLLAALRTPKTARDLHDATGIPTRAIRALLIEMRGRGLVAMSVRAKAGHGTERVWRLAESV